MNDTIIEFAFGAALGNSNVSFEKLNKTYNAICIRALDSLKGQSPDVNGYGWLSLPEADLTSIKEMGDWLKGYDSIVQVGIGGSSLGSLMLNQAILGDYFNDMGNKPKFFVADNPDPVKMSSIWNKIKKGSVALIGVSKSGNTVETTAQFLWFREQMKTLDSVQGNVDNNILVITDPSGGLFRAFSRECRCKSIDLPSSVGGRYSVLSSAGLVTAHAMGINVDNLLFGAKKMSEFLFSSECNFNPACILAKLNCFHEKSGRSISVMMPYSSKMSFFTEWFAQLWGESLGKEGKGTTPLRSIGATDQHSQLQLYMDGPEDKFFTIIIIKKQEEEVFVPTTDIKAFSSVSYLYSMEVGEMLELEARSTVSALIKSEHPVVLIELERLDEKTLGALIFFYQFLTALTGKMRSINPFDQPSVEQGKRYTRGLMGCKNFIKDAEEVKGYIKKIKTKSIKF